MSMDVLPHLGLGDLRFGMTMQQVRTLIGQPSEISNFFPLKDDLEFRDVVWCYDNGVELNFSSDDNFILGTISTESEGAIFLGKQIVGKPISEILLQIPDFKLDDDFAEIGQDYKIEDLDVSIWVSNGFIDSISVYPDYDNLGHMISGVPKGGANDI